MHSQETDLLLRIFIGENDHFDGSPLCESIISRRANKGLPAQPYCVDRWGLDIRAVSVQLKFCAFHKIFLLLSRSSILRKRSLPFCRCSTGW